MATEEFKHVTKELLDNYLELRQTMTTKGFENIKFSFKEYLDHYIAYVENVGEDLVNYEDDVVEDEDDQLEEFVDEVHPSYKGEE